MNKSLFYRIFSVLRILLYPLTLIYGALVWTRNRLYDTGVMSAVEFSVPVICVGNLSTGGTGKTPHIEYLVRLLQYRFRVATMSRGYKRQTQGFLIADADTDARQIGDEPMQYVTKFPELVVSVAEDRMTGIPMLLQKRPEVEVILLDDAYQHRSVKAGLNILVTDYAKPYYRDVILPFGSLREARSAADRANVIIVSKCPANMTLAEADEMRTLLNPAEGQKLFFTTIGYETPYDFYNAAPAAITGRDVIMVSGIAKPALLMHHLESLAASVHPLVYKDHHDYGTGDIDEMNAAFTALRSTNKCLVTTEKDAARLRLHIEKLAALTLPIVVIPISMIVLFDQKEIFDNLVTEYVEQTLAEMNSEGLGQYTN